MSKIKFIYFDVGGVLIKDFSKTDKFNELLDDLGLNQIQKDNFIDRFSEKEDEICKGLLSCEVFLESYPEYSQFKLKGEYSLCQDFVDRFELNTSIHGLVDQLTKKYKVGLLTNMYLGMLDKIKQRELLPSVKWDVEVDSSVVNLAKPHAEIFQLAQKLAKVEPGEILYIDNTQKHLDAAKKEGWSVFLYDPADTERSTRELLNFIEDIS